MEISYKKMSGILDVDPMCAVTRRILVLPRKWRNHQQVPEVWMTGASQESWNTLSISLFIRTFFMEIEVLDFVKINSSYTRPPKLRYNSGGSIRQPIVINYLDSNFQ